MAAIVALAPSLFYFCGGGPGYSTVKRCMMYDMNPTAPLNTHPRQPHVCMNTNTVRKFMYIYYDMSINAFLSAYGTYITYITYIHVCMMCVSESDSQDHTWGKKDTAISCISYIHAHTYTYIHTHICVCVRVYICVCVWYL
jgi:hypothetical protein